MALRLGRPIAIGAAALLLAAVGGGVLATLRHPMAAPRAGSATRIDYSNDQEANLAAGNASQPLTADLWQEPNYAETQIVSSGIEVDLVGKPTAAERAIAVRDTRQYRGQDIPIRFRSVRYSQRELKAVTMTLEADRAELAKQGIELSTWGINAHDRVEVSLAHYKPAYRAVLLARYGDRITVDPYDLVVGNQ
ncbi:MAG TPA: hypothetical protein VFU36_07250 [Jatrophihabitans sp.]|nr:hypothetical protein [Jatrophihabitans sp.]